MAENIIQIDSSNLEDILEKVNIIMRQTDYSEQIAREKLVEFNNDHLRVIKFYFGITDKPATKPLKSLNQEIYRQIRTKLDTSIMDYNKKQEIKLQNDIDNNSKIMN